METASEHIKSVLKFVTGESSDVCRLCLDATNSNALSLEDNAMLDRPYFEGVVTYSDMLMTLGVTEEQSMPLLLCPKCANHVTEAYLFQKLTQYSNTKWEEILEKINITLDLSNQLRNNIKTVHILMGETESQIFSSRKFCKTKQEALSKVKILIMQQKCKKKAKIKPKPQVICEECGEKLPHVLLTKHMLSHSNKLYPCSECPKVFKTVWSLKDHNERQHAPKNIQCPKCAKMLSTERLLRMHDEREHKATVCNLCFIQLPSKTALVLHLNKHNRHKCMKCGKMFGNKLSFRVHEKTCGEKHKVFCDICQQSYSWKNALRSHLKIKHGFGKVVYSCSWCDKKFDAASRLKNHIVKHTKEKNFHCEKCGGLFVTQAALVYHTRLHTGEKPFKCDVCSESFLSASRRMEHKRRKHIGPQRQCPFCDSKFITGHSLKKHVARHKNPQSKLFVEETNEIRSEIPKLHIIENILIKYED